MAHTRTKGTGKKRQKATERVDWRRVTARPEHGNARRHPAPAHPPCPSGPRRSRRRITIRTRQGLPSPEPSPSPRGASLSISVIKRTRHVNTRSGDYHLCALCVGAQRSTTRRIRLGPLPENRDSCIHARTVYASDGLVRLVGEALVGHIGGRGLRGRRAAVHLAPDALADALGVPAPAVREPVDQFQAAAVGLVALGVPGPRGQSLESATSRRTVPSDSPGTPGRERRSTAGHPVCTTALVTSSETSRISVSASGSSASMPDPASLDRAHLRARPTSAGSGRISSCT